MELNQKNNLTPYNLVSDTLIIPARELDSLYISVKNGKWIQEGPVTKVTQKYGGSPPFIPEATKCWPCELDSVKIRDGKK